MPPTVILCMLLNTVDCQSNFVSPLFLLLQLSSLLPLRYPTRSFACRDASSTCSRASYLYLGYGPLQSFFPRLRILLVMLCPLYFYLFDFPRLRCPHRLPQAPAWLLSLPNSCLHLQMSIHNSILNNMLIRTNINCGNVSVNTCVRMLKFMTILQENQNLKVKMMANGKPLIP